MKPRRIFRAAFTLVEVLLAIAILSLIMTAIYASWTSILRGSKAGLDAASQVQRERIARQTLEAALSSALLFQENVRYYGFFADTTDERFAMLSFVAKLPESFPGSGLFPNEPVRRVMFSVEPGSGGAGVLTLRQHSILAPTNAAEEAFRIVLVSNVMAFGLEFWETNLNEFSSEWIASNSLPRMVRASLGFGKPGSGAAGQLFSSVVALPALAVPREVQIPNAPQGGGAAGTRKELGLPRGTPAGGGFQVSPGGQSPAPPPGQPGFPPQGQPLRRP